MKNIKNIKKSNNKVSGKIKPSTDSFSFGSRTCCGYSPKEQVESNNESKRRFPKGGKSGVK
ncbi:hypothetical protein ACQR3C_01210 [Clostridium perfringens]|uniref:hypothetical protein n=1 Tax=Clostridium perfringens TaxID=1502 RepID=UPI001CACA469|nr:hypothetical protein [Clostridium perfringens]HBI7094620.1 hypothetical protein [Clostridium perfringens]